MNLLFYSKSSTSACFIWPALAVNFQGDFWIELAWLSWAIGVASIAENPET